MKIKNRHLTKKKDDDGKEWSDSFEKLLNEENECENDLNCKEVEGPDFRGRDM